MEVRPYNSENEIKAFQEMCEYNFKTLKNQIGDMDYKASDYKTNICERIDDSESNLRVWIILSFFVMIFLSLWMIIGVARIEKNVKELDAKITAMETKLDDLEVKADEVIKKLNTMETEANQFYKEFGEFKSFMYYSALNSNSLQGQIQKTAYSDENGFRRIDDMYIVATGSYFGDVGDILKISLSNGNTFLAVKGDMKADKDTDENNQICIHDNSVVEFIMDKETINKTIRKLGNISALEEFKGSVTNIEIVGHYEI